MLSDITRIPLRKLFFVTVTIKLVASFLAWYVSSPWILGFLVPIVVMLGYIALGFKRPPGDVSDERFGDSCYYLGFIFTISSIAFSLFDVPQLNEAGKLKDVAVRFGAAMVSTLLGFVVRVYLVGFRRDSTEALQSLEDQIIDSATALQSRLDLSSDAFKLFTDKVQKAAGETEARVRIATEGVGQHLSKEMADALKAIAADVQQVHTTAADEVRQASKRMSDELTKCAKALVADVNRAQALFVGLEAALTTRLRNISFPDDFFTKELAPPVKVLVDNVTLLGADLTALKGTVQQSAISLATAMAKIEVAMEVPQSVRELVQKQEVLGKELLGGMATASTSLQGSAAAVKDQGATLARILEKISGAHVRQDKTVDALADIAQELAASQKAHQEVAKEIARLVNSLLVKQLESLPRPVTEVQAPISPTPSSEPIPPQGAARTIPSAEPPARSWRDHFWGRSKE